MLREGRLQGRDLLGKRLQARDAGWRERATGVIHAVVIYGFWFLRRWLMRSPGWCVRHTVMSCPVRQAEISNTDVQ